MTINRGKLLKTIGWTAVGVGLYLVGLGVNYDSDSESIQPDENVIDAEFTIVEE
jgi:hypothetical protein